MARNTVYSYLWANYLEPGYESLKTKDALAIKRRLKTGQYQSGQGILDGQWSDLAALLAHAQAHVPFYRRFFSQAGLSAREVVQARDLSLLPVITREMLMAQPADFASDPLPPGSFKKATGGSTGEPLRFWVCPASNQWRMAMTRRGYGWAGAINGKRAVYVWSRDIYAKTPAHQAKETLHRRLLRARYFSNFELSQDRLAELTELIDRFRPRYLVCYTTSADTLARYALKTGWRPRSPLESVVVGAEKLFEPQREMIESGLGCPVFESYGSREFMLIAMECEAHAGLHISAENLMVEIMGPDGPCPPGHSGQVLVTDLHNFAQPFIRYQNGDLATWLEGACPCGRHLPRLASVDGRALDLIRGLDGRPLTGVFFPHMLKEFPVVKHFQVVQTAPDSLTIRVVPEGEFPAATQEAIIEQVLKVLPGLQVRIVLVDELEKTATGKIRVTIGLPQ
ncbi:MAG: phenylacetate--CoA ligase family protein [Pseudomonadota bacterium]